MDVQGIGLPTGQEFAITEGASNMKESTVDFSAVGSQINIWTWTRPPDDAEQRMIKRVPLPEAVIQQPVPASSADSFADGKSDSVIKDEADPNSLLKRILEGQSTDWATVRSMAKRIADPNYSLREFLTDLFAFPELNLYLLEADQTAQISSG